MKKSYSYSYNGKKVERQINYIPIRFIISIMLAVLQIVLVLATMVACCYFIPYFYTLAIITQFACVLKIVVSNDNPDYKVPWLLVVLIIPVIGFMLYFMFYSRKLQKKYVKRLERVYKVKYKKSDTKDFEKLKKENQLVYSHVKMLSTLADTHLFTDTLTKYYPCGEETLPDMIKDLKNAKKFIFLEYFIIEEGVFWDSILEVLKDKVKSGVEVKVIYDDIGCMGTLPGGYYKTLKSYGIDCAIFSKLKGNADSEFNNRSHRKLLIIDGIVGYTGGINLADEYINKVERFGYWKDTALRLEGQAVNEFTRLFLVDFYVNKKEEEKISKDYYTDIKVDGEGYVVPFGDGPRPLYDRRVAKSVILNMLDSSIKSVIISTPYLIIDNDMCVGLESAALRGVDVKIILPGIPDKKIVYAIGKTYILRLQKAGIKVYKYKKGFIHAKTYLSDDEYCMIGTVNLDYRSLAHHFENGVLLYKDPSVKDIKSDLEKTLNESVKFSEKELKGGVIKRFFVSIIKIFAPLF